MKKIIQIITIGLFVSNVCWGQTWYFGQYAGIEFNSNGTVTSVAGSQMSTGEGCAMGYGKDRKLLFYTDGVNVYRADNNSSIANDLKGNWSSSQSAIVVPKTGSCDTFYIFTVNSSGSTNIGDDANQNSALYYSKLAYNYSTQTFVFAQKNKQLNPGVRFTEKLTGYKRSNGDYWVVAHDFNNSKTPISNTGRSFYAYKISSNGISTAAIISSTGKYHHTKDESFQRANSPCGNFTWQIGNTQGYMKFSQDGRRIALAVATGFVEIFDFNENTGDISSEILLDMFNDKLRDENTNYANTPTDNKHGVLYGIEFSKNGRYLYTSEVYSYTNADDMHILQFDIGQFSTPADLWQNRREITKKNFPCGSNFTGSYGALQMGPDGNIYVARSMLNYISRIENTESVNANFNDNAVTLLPNQTSRIGLPTMLVNDVSCGACARCHNVTFNFNGQKTVRKDTTIVLNCNTRNIAFNTNVGCNAPNVVQVLGCTVTDVNGATQSWASAFTNTKGTGSLNIPNAASPPVTYYVDYYFGTMNSPGTSGPRFDTCDHIRLTIIDSCTDVPCICPPKPIITLKQKFRPGTVKQLNCGASEEIECNKLYTLDVDPACQPAGCSDKRYEISVRANGGPTQTFINQAVNIQPLATDKEFTITIKTYCGGRLCTTCTITLTVKCKCPPPPCCKTPVGTEFNAAVSTVREVSGTSFANLSFALNGNGKQYTQVRASVISFGIKADDKKCLDCYNNSRQWASISGGNLTGVQGFSRVISGDNNGVNTNTREVTYTSSTPQIINTAQLTLNLMLPPMQTLSCCKVYATVYIKFTYRDNQCNECEKIIGIKIPLNEQQGKGPELINVAANVRAAAP